MLFAALFTAFSFGLAPGAANLVEFDEVVALLQNPKVRILDTRPLADYNAGHIPGAVWVDVSSATKLAARPGGLADPKPWQEWIAPLGLTPGTRVLIYDGARQLESARTWWLLTYLGVENVALINGNFTLWSKQSRPTTQDIAKVAPGTIEINLRKDRVANRDDVLDSLKSKQVKVVDARTTEEHTGAVAKSKRGGRIPESCHLEWNTLVDAEGKFLETAALKAKIDKLGIKAGEPVITHCQGGGRAAVDAFVFEKLGFSTRNYYVGWSDWGNADDTPVKSDQR